MRAEACPNRDHPSFVAALGLLPGLGRDRETMRRTLAGRASSDWDLRQTWGWDWPMLAMTAARLDEPEMAVDFLLTDAKNFQFGVSGMTPRVHVLDDDAPHAAGRWMRRDIGAWPRPTFRPMAHCCWRLRLMANNPIDSADRRWVIHAEGFKPLP